MQENGHIPDFCIVGEPTCPVQLGDMVKIGRRGSINATITVHGTQGHVAYPQRTDNPIHRLVRALNALTDAPIDAGSEFFQPSTLQVTSIDVGNTVTNLVPASARAMLNIRFNERHSGATLAAWLRAVVAQYADNFEIAEQISGESFLTQPGPMVDRLVEAITRESGITPKLDTGGGTSDARFIARYCPVAEFGLVGATMHQVDECVPIDELHTLTRIYRAVIATMVP
jgi:succinyl-diaminopimelate desuccinylase